MFNFFIKKSGFIVKEPPVDPMIAIQEAAQRAIEEKKVYQAKASNPNFAYSDKEFDFAKQVIDNALLVLPDTIKKDYLRSEDYVLLSHKEDGHTVHTKCSGVNDPVFKEAQRRLAEIGLTCSLGNYYSHDHLILVNIPLSWTPTGRPQT